MKCDIICEPHEIVADQTRSTAIFRILQETLTNVARHADATEVEIALKEKTDEVELIVHDNGKGITKKEVSDPKSFGLMGIKERVHSLGGIAEFIGSKNEGTTVKVVIPSDSSEERDIDQNLGSR